MKQLTEEQLQEIRSRCKNATPGPWFWYGNLQNYAIYLVTENDRWPGWSVVMDVVRWGLKSATPRFIDKGGLMHKASEDPMPVYQVCPDCTSRQDERVYRQHIVGLRHPDAEFIAASRQDVQDLLDHTAYLEEEIREMGEQLDDLIGEGRLA